MTTLDSEALNLIDLMLEDFSNRLRAGENPSIESYVQKHPALEREIREALSIAGRIESVQRQEDRRTRQTSGSLLPRATDPFPILANYRFIREIGRGGMGVVFEAEHVELRRRVALKILASFSTRRERHGSAISALPRILTRTQRCRLISPVRFVTWHLSDSKDLSINAPTSTELVWSYMNS